MAGYGLPDGQSIVNMIRSQMGLEKAQQVSEAEAKVRRAKAAKKALERAKIASANPSVADRRAAAYDRAVKKGIENPATETYVPPSSRTSSVSRSSNRSNGLTGVLETGRYPTISSLGGAERIVGGPMRTIETAAGRVAVDADAAPVFQSFINELAKVYDINSLGGYARRNIAGTGIPSLHSLGFAIDINPGNNPVTYGHIKTDMPNNVGEMARKYGLVWGGDWNGPKYDTMHFSIPYGGRK